MTQWDAAQLTVATYLSRTFPVNFPSSASPEGGLRGNQRLHVFRGAPRRPRLAVLLSSSAVHGFLKGGLAGEDRGMAVVDFRVFGRHWIPLLDLER